MISTQFQQEKKQMKQKEKIIGLPPKSPAILIPRPDINRSGSIASQGILSLPYERKLLEMKKSWASPSSSKGKEVMAECSIKNEIDCKSQINTTDPEVDAVKRERRMLANRISAQKCRLKKIHYISQLEMNMKALEEEISIISPQIRYHDNQRRILSSEKGVIHQRMAALMHEKVFKEAEYENMKKERDKLVQLTVLQEQQQQHQPLQPQQDFLMLGNPGVNMVENSGVTMMENQRVKVYMNFRSSSSYNMF